MSIWVIELHLIMLAKSFNKSFLICNLLDQLKVYVYGTRYWYSSIAIRSWYETFPEDIDIANSQHELWWHSTNRSMVFCFRIGV